MAKRQGQYGNPPDCVDRSKAKVQPFEKKECTGEKKKSKTCTLHYTEQQLTLHGNPVEHTEFGCQTRQTYTVELLIGALQTLLGFFRLDQMLWMCPMNKREGERGRERWSRRGKCTETEKEQQQTIRGRQQMTEG